MPGPLIGNAGGAFAETLDTPSAQHPQSVVLDVYNGGTTAIPAQRWVGLDITGTGAHVFAVTQGLHGADADSAIGVSIDTIPAGGVGRVVVYGPALCLIGTGGVTANDMLTPDSSATYDGGLITGSDTPEVGELIARALTTTAAAAIGSVWVCKL